MDCQDIMEMKLKIMEALGVTKELRDIYCEEAPKQDINPSVGAYCIDNIKKATLKLLEQDKLDSSAVFILCTGKCCPYCQATGNDCLDCNYGSMYGICDDYNSRWSKAVEAFQRRPIYNLRVNKNEVIQLLEDLIG